MAELEAKGLTVITLDYENALATINEYLASHDNIDAVHLVTHGNEGVFKIGAANVDADYVAANSAAIQGWSDSLNENADIMIYGCNLAATQDGVDLISSIAGLTGADVAASIDTTGIAGNWTLEVSTGDIDTEALYLVTSDAELLAGYYRSVATGDWNTFATTWEYSANGTSGWAAATDAPGVAALGINVQVGNTVTVDGVLTASELTVNGTLTVSNALTTAGTFTISGTGLSILALP